MLDQFTKPSIGEIAGRYTNLRRHGKQLMGLCPFHTEKTPSFAVNEDKGVFHCFGCGEAGDAVSFIEKIEGVDFKGAIAILGLADQPRPTSAEIIKRENLRQASKNLTAWALDMAERVGTAVRGAGQRGHMAGRVLKEVAGADKKFLRDEIKRSSREWIILTTLEEDLLDPDRALDLWQERELIEQLVGDSRTYSKEEIENMHPPFWQKVATGNCGKKVRIFSRHTGKQKAECLTFG